jgi:hypothetical protein
MEKDLQIEKVLNPKNLPWANSFRADAPPLALATTQRRAAHFSSAYSPQACPIEPPNRHRAGQTARVPIRLGKLTLN